MSHDGFIDHCLELLAPLGRARARRMFGGHGLYVDDLFIAIVDDQRLYLKADAESAGRFAAAGGQAFSYVRSGKTAQLGFWSVPDDAMDAADRMRPWGQLALQAALRARAVAAPAPRRKPR